MPGCDKESCKVGISQPPSRPIARRRVYSLFPLHGNPHSLLHPHSSFTGGGLWGLEGERELLMLLHSTQMFLANWITMLETFQSALVRRTRLLLSLKGTARRINNSWAQGGGLVYKVLLALAGSPIHHCHSTSQKKCRHLHHITI